MDPELILLILASFILALASIILALASIILTLTPYYWYWDTMPPWVHPAMHVPGSQYARTTVPAVSDEALGLE